MPLSLSLRYPGISIHAPARGATKSQFLLHYNNKISIHAPARGATRRRSQRRQMIINFNPRSREGSDYIRYRCDDRCKADFNPRSREGSDYRHTLENKENEIFQSTLPRGERQRALSLLSKTYQYFNPRSREGSDSCISSPFVKKYISIHAPARGATILARSTHT